MVVSHVPTFILLLHYAGGPDSFNLGSGFLGKEKVMGNAKDYAHNQFAVTGR